MIATKIRNRLNQIPQARPADRSAFYYALERLHLFRWAAGFAFGKSVRPARIAEDPLGSEKPKLPQGKPAGFIVHRPAYHSDRAPRFTAIAARWARG